MYNNLYIDIETIPAQRPDVIAEIRASQEAKITEAIASLSAPGNYGAEAAAKYIANKAEALRASFDADVDEAYRKTGLDGAYGHVCVIGWAINDGEITTHKSIVNEGTLLREFNAALDASVTTSESFKTCVVGHNVAAFDLRFLAQRHIINGIRPHMVISRAAQAKPWEVEKVFDTMVQWSGIGNRISLDKLCKALGLPSPKGEIDGSKVWDAVRDGRLQEVADYCARDIEAVRQVHLRMTYQVEPAQAA